MKKCFYFFFIGIFLFATESLYSQIKLGLQFGPNFAEGSYSSNYYTTADLSGKTGFFGGLLAEIKLTKMFHIQPEIIYIQRGIKVSPFNNVSTQAAPLLSIISDFNFDFIEIPINIIAKFSNEQLKPFLFAGPSFNFLITAEKTEKYIVYKDIGPYSIKDYMKKNDIAINFGGGLEYAVNPKLDVFALLRYSICFSDLFKETTINYVGYTDAAGDDEKFKAKGFSFGIGFKFSVLGYESKEE